MVRSHQGMQVRFATTLQPPSGVQDVGCAVVGCEPDDIDKDAQMAVDSQHYQGENISGHIPKAIYVKIVDCVCHFLPRAPCSTHRLPGRDTFC